ncbi:MAG: Lrp/AsnC family transcriptional regulator [Candidatus Woesearchaeota archaeon]|nr:Lrp/AsnC family transcriptional regulator [Candidatus Woesearchaeota archaeon]
MDNTEPIKLDKIDRKILLELDKNCRISDTQLAKKAGRSREAVKYRIKQLIEKGIIEKFITSINHAKLGISYYKIFLQLENIPEEKEKLFAYIGNHKKIPWHGICSGVWDYIIGVSAESSMEFDRIKNEIFTKFKHLIIKKEIGLMVETKQYVKKYLTGGIYDVKSFAGEIVRNEIDELDQKILDILANNARIPIAHLAKEASSSVKTVSTRIKNLEEKGIIIGYRISVDINKLGLEFFKIILYYRSISPEEERKLLEYIKRLPQSIYYIKMIAPWDAELEMIVNNYHELNKIVDDLRKEFHEIIRNHETVIIHRENWLPAIEKETA